tara:strand:+ start:13429 stop:14199 length:771 start_codon:yes stop_codon:yes gene_type:complete
MDKQELINKIISKKEFSQLPKRDVELAFEHFDEEAYVDEEKVKFTRNLLRKVFSAFTSQKILSLKNKSPEWILKKHLSTRERFNFYEEIYKRLFKGLGKKLSIIDLGSGINGFSYKYFKEIANNSSYIAIESMGQLVSLMNNYFEKEKINGKAVHLSLFELENVKKLIEKTEKPRIIFLFKTIDSLEILKRDYSKKLILEIVPLVERVVISFATESMIKRKKFKVKRNWIINFLKENFSILDDFELGGERYIIFNK